MSAVDLPECTDPRCARVREELRRAKSELARALAERNHWRGQFESFRDAHSQIMKRQPAEWNDADELE